MDERPHTDGDPAAADLSRADSSATDSAFLGRVACYLDDLSTDDELRQLNAELEADREKRREFIRLCRTRALLVEYAGSRRSVIEPDDSDDAEAAGEVSVLTSLLESSDLNETMILPAPRGDAMRHAAAVDDDTVAIPWVETVQSRAAKPTRRPYRWAAAILLPLLAGVVLWTVIRTKGAVGPTVTLANAVGAEWGHARQMRIGHHLPDGPNDLKRGVAHLMLVNGVSAMVEGPAKFEITSDTTISLTSGKIVIRVPHVVGTLTVTTPTGRVVDLGTEFGVEVAVDRPVHVQVFEGGVRVEPKSVGTVAVASQVLSVGQAANMTTGAVNIDPAGAVLQRFVRTLTPPTSPIDLVDLLNGGDGTSGRRGLGIDSDGTVGLSPGIGVHTGREFRAIAGIPVLDGCFAIFGPNTRVDSAGHTYDFPPANGAVYGNVWLGGAIPAVPANDSPSSTLGATDYATPAHSLIFMSGNRGVTVDLTAVRRLYPGRSLSRFLCVVGNSDKAAPTQGTLADAHVLVDGRRVFEERKFTRNRGAISVDVPLADGDQFLTLAITDGGDSIGNDGIIWGDPHIELK